MQVPFVDLKAQHEPLVAEALVAFERILRDGSFILGRDVAELEEGFAAYSDAKYAIGVDNGLSALKLALLAHNIGAGDEVIVPVNTFMATAAAVSFTGATPVFVDQDAVTYNIDPNKIEQAITPKTRAIMAVHLYGTPADMDPILAIANKHNLVVIEDSAQAHGARYNGKRTGSMGHAAGFSFYPAKNMGAAGDAGIVTTNDAAIADKIRAMRNVGQVQKNVHSVTPNNHRLDTIQAALLKIKLRYIDGWNDARRHVAARFDAMLKDCNVIRPAILPNMEQVWHLYVIRVEDRERFQAFAHSQGIATGIHYPIPLHLQPYYAHLGYRKGDFPIAESYADHLVSLPIFETMSDAMVDSVVNMVRQFDESLEKAL